MKRCRGSVLIECDRSFDDNAYHDDRKMRFVDRQSRLMPIVTMIAIAVLFTALGLFGGFPHRMLFIFDGFVVCWSLGSGFSGSSLILLG